MSKPIDEMKVPEAFRERLLATTLVAVRRRVRRRRALLACAIAGAYTIGVLSTGWLGGSAPPVQMATESPTRPHVQQIPVDDTLHPAERAALMVSREPPEQRREVLRTLGNRWLNEYGDIARATACYGRFLDKLPANELDRFDPDDTWLLRALRSARLQENAHENASI